MSTSGKGKGPFGSEWPTPENTTGKDLDPRAAGDSANEAALKDFFFGSSATVHDGGAVTLTSSAALAGTGAAVRAAAGAFACNATLTGTGTLITTNWTYQWRGRGSMRGGGWRRGKL